MSDIGAVLAGIGNHEGKALLWLAMEPGEGYGISALHRLFLEIQGPQPAFTGTVTLQQKHCVWSMEPAGLVLRTTNERGWLRHVKPDDAPVATALAGHLLATIEDHPATLAQIFGKTAGQEGFGGLISGTDADAEISPPLRRLAVLRALAGCGDQARTTDIAEEAGLRSSRAGEILDLFAEFGLLSYRVLTSEEIKSQVRVTRPVPLVDNRRLSNQIAIYLNDRLARSGSRAELVVSSGDITAHIASLPRWRERFSDSVSTNVRTTLARMAGEGVVELLDTYGGYRHRSLVEMTAGQRAFISRLAGGIDKIAAGDDAALADGIAQARKIIDDPVRVRALIAKSYRANKIVVNPVTRQQKRDRVLAALSSGGDVSAAALLERLGSDFNKTLLTTTLSELARAGQVRGVKKAGISYKFWSLA